MKPEAPQSLRFILTGSLSVMSAKAAARASMLNHLAIEPEHFFSVMLSKEGSTAYHVLKLLSLANPQTIATCDAVLSLFSAAGTAGTLQRSGRLRPMMAASLWYSHHSLDHIVYSASLVYAAIAAVPGRLFDELRTRVEAKSVHEAVVESLNTEPVLWKSEYESSGTLSWEITIAHFQKIAREVECGHIEIPFT